MTEIIKHRSNGQGYLLNDNRASGGKKEEDDVWTCAHCQKLVLGMKWKLEGGWCHRCMAPVCAGCSDKMLTEGCKPFLKEIEKSLEEAYRARQNARVLGI